MGQERGGKCEAEQMLNASHVKVSLPRRAAPGFTLVELLVAMALFTVLMSGVVMLFVGSVRSARTSYQQIDAFEKARSALTIVQNDLATTFTAVQNDDRHSFYGSPIGMTFVGLVTTTTNSGNFSIARITYVVYNHVITKGGLTAEDEDAYPYRFPEALENALVDIDGNPIYLAGTQEQKIQYMDGYPYPLLRFIETDATDLNRFPIPWNAASSSGSTYLEILNQLCGFDTSSKNLTEAQRERVWMATCEMWIRMLAGGDTIVPVDYWTDTSLHPTVKNPLDYMVADNILVAYPPNRITAQHPLCPELPADPIGNRRDRPFCSKGFFDYDMIKSFSDNLETNGSGNKKPNVWWNDCRSSAVNVDTDYIWDCLSTTEAGTANCVCGSNCDTVEWSPHLPEIVTMSFWLMFESPFPGAPDFKRHFSLRINIPAAYSRSTE